MANTKLSAVCSNLAIFPCRQNSKLPATKNGFKDARRGQILEEFLDQGCNYGIACEMSNLVVIDQDVDESKGYNGIETIKRFEEVYGPLPKTFTVRTPRGGLHYYFSSKGLQNPIGKIGNDVDVKFRGYVIGPESQIDGKKYKALDEIEGYKLEIAELPQSWLDFLNRNVGEKKTFKGQKTKLTPMSVDFQRILENCSFIKHCYENAETLSEPEWFSMINILAFAMGSDELIHRISEPHPNYSFEETQKKIENARKFGNPQRCSYISSNYPEICTGCLSANKNKGE